MKSEFLLQLGILMLLDIRKYLQMNRPIHYGSFFNYFNYKIYKHYYGICRYIFKNDLNSLKELNIYTINLNINEVKLFKCIYLLKGIQ